jgi:hypothetical protein
VIFSLLNWRFDDAWHCFIDDVFFRFNAFEESYVGKVLVRCFNIGTL